MNLEGYLVPGRMNQRPFESTRKNTFDEEELSLLSGTASRPQRGRISSFVGFPLMRSKTAHNFLLAQESGF